MVMPRLPALIITVLSLLSSALATDPKVLASRALRIDPDVRARIGKRVWMNECDCSVTDLVDWNNGEPCASLGIGHFIWYPTVEKGRFDESFPPLLSFIQSRGGTLPVWLTPQTICPWPNYESFKKIQANDPQINELRAFLKETVALQAEFLAQRCAESLGKMLASCSPEEADPIRAAFAALSSSGDGLYCLMDYTNFKGEGTKLEERNQGQGWGLMQVLLEMERPLPGPAMLTTAFAESAKRVLTRRVNNAAPKNKALEEKNLKGWLPRCDSYKRGL